MRRVMLKLAYDGTAYAGWQFQPKCRTLQGELEAAWTRITGETSRSLASGRTDAGVHARGQVAGIRTHSTLPADVLCRALNAELPHDMAVLDVTDVPAGFHPIRDVVRKRYEYTLSDRNFRDVFRRNYCWQLFQSIDVDSMRAAAAHLRGRHDFASFQSKGNVRKTTVRTMHELSIERGAGECDHLITFGLEANGFLYNMVRIIVGTLVEIGRGVQPVDWPIEILQAAIRTAAGPTAPAQGLCLVRVDYGVSSAEFSPAEKISEAAPVPEGRGE